MYSLVSPKNNFVVNFLVTDIEGAVTVELWKRTSKPLPSLLKVECLRNDDATKRYKALRALGYRAI